MYCKKCGNEIHEGENFCGKCGANIIEQDNGNISKKKIKTKYIVMSIIIMLIIILGVIFIVFGKNNGNEASFGISNILKKELNKEQVMEIIKNTEDGKYLTESSIKIGNIIDYNYDIYNKLVAYDATFLENNNTVKYSAILFINEDNKDCKNIAVCPYVVSVFFDLINSKENDENLEQVTKIVADFVNNQGTDVFENIYDNFEEYLKLGEQIGEVIGVKQGRNIVAKGLFESSGGQSENNELLFKENEIFPRYIGEYKERQVYNWPLDETQAKLLYNNNRKTYNNMLAIYGSPYKTIKSFVVYDITVENMSAVGTYGNVETAALNLKAERINSDGNTNLNKDSKNETSDTQEQEQNIEDPEAEKESENFDN